MHNNIDVSNEYFASVMDGKLLKIWIRFLHNAYNELINKIALIFQKITRRSQETEGYKY